MRQLREIYFESSARKVFADEKEKEAFFQKYMGWYLTHYPEYAWVALGDKVLGYVVVSPTSSEEELNKIQPHLEVFSEYFHDYPANLHINLHHESRGLGVGQKLMQMVFESLQKHNIRGLHIMTSSDARNKSFYARLGFSFEVQLPFNGVSILFMGKSL